ncbi:MAG TPA: polysaccharide deacetylase family protein [Dehalococcoidia bacterium]|nr:polysaccharide deacetylase family protein [Dehalococcoidia bacterium]
MPPGVRYVVQAGDTLTAIADRFGTTVEAIVEANGLADPDEIVVGQILFIPTTGPLPSPTPPGAAQVIRRGDASSKAVALSFDAASDAGFTAQILDTLEANGISASFSISGQWAERNPDLVRRIAREGHLLMNHSHDHASFTGLSTGEAPLTRAERWEQLDRTDAAVQDLTGRTTRPYFRPPYGDYDASVNADLAARGYAYNVLWTVDSGGWAGLPAADIVRRCLDGAEPGAIYVFHVGAASEDAAALQRIIDGLREVGYAMTTVSGLIAP